MDVPGGAWRSRIGAWGTGHGRLEPPVLGRAAAAKDHGLFLFGERGRWWRGDLARGGKGEGWYRLVRRRASRQHPSQTVVPLWSLVHLALPPSLALEVGRPVLSSLFAVSPSSTLPPRALTHLSLPCRAVPCRASPPRADGQRQTSGSVPSDTGTWVESSTASRCRIRCIFICRQHSTRHSLRQGVHSGRLPRPLHGKGAGRGPNGGQVFRTRPVPIALSLPAAASSDNTTTPGSAKKNNRQAAAAVPNWTSRTGCHDGCPPECDSNTRTTLLATKNWLRLILGLGFTVDQSLRPGR